MGMDEKTIHILLVEGKEGYAEMIRETLESPAELMKVALARNLREARACLQESPPDLVVSDLILDDGSGFEFLAGPKGIRYPAVILDNPENRRMETETMQTGELSYVVKSSAKLADLPRIVKKALGKWEEMTAEQAQSLAKLPSENPNPVLRIRKDGTTLYTNSAAATMLSGWNCQPGAKTPPPFLQYVETAFSTHKEQEFEVDFKNRVFLFWLNAAADMDYVNIYGYDITEHKRTELALRESELHISAILDNAMDGIVIVNKNRRLVLFNRACEKLYGYSREEVVNKAYFEFSHFERIWKGKSYSAVNEITLEELVSKKERMKLPHKGGKEIWVETTFTPIYDQESGKISYVMGVIKDISEIKKMEEEKQSLLEELGKVRASLEWKYDFSSIVGGSPQILKTLKLSAQVAKQNTTVMLLGESGTGKELLAKAIHYNSQRASKPFFALNCSAFPDSLIESELFGYEKGAFTGAEKSKPGKVQLADQGTLFLDEVTEMSTLAQAKILRLLQEHEFEPLGSVKTRRVDLRIIAATNKNLDQLVEEGKFRDDLYYRLFVYPINIPPLRERREDLPILVEYFIRKLNKAMGKQIRGLTQEAMAALIHYPWPGNIRELQNVVERFMILAKNNPINVMDLPVYLIEDTHLSPARDALLSVPAGFTLKKHVRQVESKAILKTLKECGFNKTQAAARLGMTRSTFRYKLSKISPPY